MRRFTDPLLFLATAVSILVPAAAAGEPPSLEDTLRRVEGLLSAGTAPPTQFDDAVLALQEAVPASGRERPADLVLRLARQLEQLAAEGGQADPERRRELVRRAGATLALLVGKLARPEPAFEASTAAVPPANDGCSDAVALAAGSFSGTTGGATNDGGASCGDSATAPDIWYSYTAASDGLVTWDTLGSSLDTVLSLHSACPDAGGDYELACNDDASSTLSSLVARNMSAGETVLVRVSGSSGATGTFNLRTRPSAGGIAGTVTKAGTGLPRDDATVAVYDSAGFFENAVQTTADGEYLVGGLVAGDWFVTASDPLLIREVWNDRQCSPCDLDAVGDPIAVVSGLVEGIDFALSPGGAVAGAVTDLDSGESISGWVSLYDASGSLVRSSSSFGSYRVGGLPSGDYTVRTGSSDHADELYDDLPCQPSCNVTEGTPVQVTAGSTTEGIDFALRRLGSIGGRVVRANDGEPIAFNGWVDVYDSAGTFRSSGSIGSDGVYEVSRLGAGSYFARASSWGFLSELYADLPCWDGCDVTTGTPIAVQLATETAGIDFSLAEPGRIEGTVTAAESGQPLGTEVHLFDESGGWVSWDWSNSSNLGAFSFGNLVPGSYFVRTESQWTDPSYEDQLYDDRGCDPSCAITEGDAVSVQLATTTTGIDFELVQCSASSHLTLTGFHLLGTQIREACRTIRVGPNATVGSTGSLVLRAGRSVALGDGFVVASGGRLEVVIDPSVGQE